MPWPPFLNLSFIKTRNPFIASKASISSHDPVCIEESLLKTLMVTLRLTAMTRAPAGAMTG